METACISPDDFLEEIVIIASEQPPLRFFGKMIHNEDFEDPLTDESYLMLTAYRDNASERIILLKQSNFVVTDDDGFTPLNRKYIILTDKRHPELFSFCYSNEHRTKRISPDFIKFLNIVGEKVYNDNFAFFLTPSEVC